MDKIVEKKIREVKVGETLIAALDGKRVIVEKLVDDREGLMLWCNHEDGSGGRWVTDEVCKVVTQEEPKNDSLLSDLMGAASAATGE